MQNPDRIPNWTFVAILMISKQFFLSIYIISYFLYLIWVYGAKIKKGTFMTICEEKKETQERKREGGEKIQGDAIVAFPSFSILGSHVGAGVCTLLEACTSEKNTKRRSSRQ